MAKLPKIITIIASILWITITLFTVFAESSYPTVRTVANIAFLVIVLACTFWHYCFMPEVFAKATVLTMHFPKPWKPKTMEVTFLIDKKKLKLELTLEQFNSITKGDTLLIKYKGPRLISFTKYRV